MYTAITDANILQSRSPIKDSPRFLKMKEQVRLYIETQKDLHFVSAIDKGDKALIFFCDDRLIPMAHVLDVGAVHIIPFTEMTGFDQRATISLKILQAYISQMSMNLKRFSDGAYGIQISGTLLGGNNTTLAVSAVQIIVGTGLTLTGPLGAFWGATLISSGVSGVGHHFEHPEEGFGANYLGNCAAGAVMGAATAGAGSAIGHFAKGAATATKLTTTMKVATALEKSALLKGAVIGVVGSTTDTTVRAAAEGRLPTMGEAAGAVLKGGMAGGTAGGLVGGISADKVKDFSDKLVDASGVSGLIKKGIEGAVKEGADEATKKLAQETAKKAIEVIRTAAPKVLSSSAGAVVGGTGAAASQVAGNIARGDDATHGVQGAFAQGAFIGAMAATNSRPAMAPIPPTGGARQQNQNDAHNNNP